MHVEVRPALAMEYMFAEVADVNTSVVYEHIRRTVLEPLAG